MFAFERILPRKAPLSSSVMASVVSASSCSPTYIPHDGREFFRVDTEIALHCRPLLADHPSVGPVWQKVNLSGGGIRFAIDEPLHIGEKAWLELEFPGQATATIRCLGRVVRRFDGENGDCQVAFEFDNLSARDQDRIIAFCLAEQRKLLRDKVRVRYC